MIVDYCRICGGTSYGRKYCYDCAFRRSNATSIVRQNTLKLIKLFDKKRYSLEGFYKFDLYVKNIQAQIPVLKEYIEADIKILLENSHSTIKKKDT